MSGLQRLRLKVALGFKTVAGLPAESPRFLEFREVTSIIQSFFLQPPPEDLGLWGKILQQLDICWAQELIFALVFGGRGDWILGSGLSGLGG